ncbi:hypothetical protein B0H14DRAFT_3007970, partial [Mycena olivaceomarginata]
MTQLFCCFFASARAALMPITPGSSVAFNHVRSGELVPHRHIWLSDRASGLNYGRTEVIWAELSRYISARIVVPMVTLAPKAHG